ncbi:hypothetical protein LCGC14_1385390 [marine sediment metagenome]|uniref:Uncharacterized protein n=1 Tax=marine sediment metagenome TaxID=412755 RepID=A0A0F9N320_9ZZZZ
MRIFKISKRIEVVAKSEKTRSGFRHLATLFVDGDEAENAKATYQNRTWEAYEFESVLIAVANKAFENKVISEEQRDEIVKFSKGDRTDWSEFKTISMVAKLGEVFGETKKEKNDWKARMLKAGLENKGLSMPEDWDELDEDTKQKRLDGVIKIMDMMSKKGEEQ